MAEVTIRVLKNGPYEVTGATRGLFGELISDKAGFAGMIFLVLVFLAALFAPWIAPYGANEGNPASSFLPLVWQDGGSWDHVLGTDAQGYDVLSRLLYGMRTTLFIGLAVVAIAGTFGVLIGLLAGYRGGRTDRMLMAWIDVQVPHCGYCQNGMMIQAADLLATTKRPTEAQIRTAMNGHLCRCGTYPRILTAIQKAAAVMAKGGK